MMDQSLFPLCHANGGACDNVAHQFTPRCGRGGYVQQCDLDITAEGEWSTAAQRKAVIQVVRQASEASQQWWNENLKNDCHNVGSNGAEVCTKITIMQYRAASFYQATLFQWKGGPSLAQLRVSVKLDEKDFDINLCQLMASNLQGAVSAVSGFTGGLLTSGAFLC